MSIFNQKSKFKVKTEIRTVRQAVAPRPKPISPPSNALKQRSSSSNFLSVPRASSHSNPGSGRAKSNSPLPGERSASRKRALPTSHSRSPASPGLFDESGDDDGEDDDWQDLDARKRRKGAHPAERVDLNRKLCHPKLGLEGERPVPIIHAADVASVRHKCQPVLKLTEEGANVRLQYPGTRDSERYGHSAGNADLSVVGS